MQITIVKLDDGKWHHTSTKGTRCGIPREDGIRRVMATMNVSSNDTFPPKSELCPKCWPDFPNTEAREPGPTT